MGLSLKKIMFKSWKIINTELYIIKNLKTSVSEDYFVIKSVEIKYPNPSDNKSRIQSKDLEVKI